MAIIALNGYSGVGKDAVGAIIQYLNCPNLQSTVSVEEVVNNYSDYEEWLDEESNWEIRKFAGKLKDIAGHLLNIDIEKFEDQEFKKQPLGKEWWTVNEDGHEVMTVRDFLQKLGTDALRNGLHDNVWVNALMADYKDINQSEDGLIHEKYGEYDVSIVPNPILWKEYYPNWIITDCRFSNEAEAVKNKGGIIIRIDRPGVHPINNHPSEVGLDDWKFDYRIVNNSDLYDLKQNVENILNHAKLL